MGKRQIRSKLRGIRPKQNKALTNRRDLFANPVHPNAQGAIVIAETLRDAITKTAP